jgi:oxaloacetate decarboxylase (Na+ extruding) subunit gamma
MTESNLISDGIFLMLTGMGTVFIFLSLLVFLTHMLYRLLGEELIVPAALAAEANNDDEIAAATAAVHAYRSKHGVKKEH